MANLGLAGLIMAYVVLAIFLLSLHLYSNWTWLVKAGATVMVAAFYFVTYFSVPQMLGWPTSYGVPEKFKLIAYSAADKKNIYIWAQKIQSDMEQSKPRAYVVPYTTPLYEKISQAGQRMVTGVTIIGEVDQMAGSRPKNADLQIRRTEQLDITFHDAPNSGNLTKD